MADVEWLDLWSATVKSADTAHLEALLPKEHAVMDRCEDQLDKIRQRIFVIRRELARRKAAQP